MIQLSCGTLHELIWSSNTCQLLFLLVEESNRAAHLARHSMASVAANGHPSPPLPLDPQPQAPKPEPDVPPTSLEDDGANKRPRDARLIHLVLSSLGIHSYQERVPLQLLDFAYRYTSSVLSDSLRLSAEGYASQAERGGRARGAGDEGITVTALRQAIASRQGYTFQGALPKEYLTDRATEHNKVALPKVERAYGVQLPPEKHCLTGVGWNIKDAWESEDDGSDDEDPVGVTDAGQDEDATMADADRNMDEDDDDAPGRMEDVFGEEPGENTSMAQD